MCDVRGNGVITTLPYGRKTEKKKQNVWLTGKENCLPAYSCAENNQSIAGASISIGERKVTAFHRLQYLLTLLLCLHQIYDSDLFRNSKRFWTVLDVCSGTLFGKMMVTSRQLAVDIFLFSLLFTVTT